MPDRVGAREPACDFAPSPAVAPVEGRALVADRRDAIALVLTDEVDDTAADT